MSSSLPFTTLLQIHMRFLNFCENCSKRVGCIFSYVIIGWLIAYLFAVLTHHWADPRWAQLLPTQQTAGQSIPTHSLLHVVQAVYQAPAAAQGKILLKMSQLIIPSLNVCMLSVSTGDFILICTYLTNHCMFCSLSPNSLLLHGLHFLSTGDNIVYNLFFFICQVWTRTRAWLHGPVAPISQTYFLVEITPLFMMNECICIHVTFRANTMNKWTCI